MNWGTENNVWGGLKCPSCYRWKFTLEAHISEELGLSEWSLQQASGILPKGQAALGTDSVQVTSAPTLPGTGHQTCAIRYWLRQCTCPPHGGTPAHDCQAQALLWGQAPALVPGRTPGPLLSPFVSTFSSDDRNDECPSWKTEE